ncbi:ZIP-like iron-zinc transporter [Mycena amicta]|nr:ZIP-like iron-zinc transporter [Mycena amicta]
MSSESECGSLDNGDSYLGLRVASVFIILLCSTSGALFPVLARRSTWLHVPKALFEFAKYFGSGVIIATAFIHLLSPALDELSSDCLSPAWQDYPYALALCLLSIMSIFILELVAFRWGTAKLTKLGVEHDAHGHNVGSHAAHGPEAPTQVRRTVNDTDIVAFHPRKSISDEDASVEGGHGHTGDTHRVLVPADGMATTVSAGFAAHVIGIAILEFGVLLHSILIGLTLAVDEGFKVLFVVIIFHQTFEGLGLGARLSTIELPGTRKFTSSSIPIFAALIYGVSTPIGIAVGLGIRHTYNPGSATASIVSGVLDALSSGVLIYTGLVELLAHEFLFNKEMVQASNGKLAYAIGSMLLGCAIMALLGRWA